MHTTDRLAEERVFELTHDELDALPYGVITLDRKGRILRYNYTEAKFARRTTAGTIGLGFFTDVAPCTNVQAFKGRFDEFAQSRDSGVEKFDFTFAFRWGHQDVSITLLRKAEHDDINLIVRGRTQATLDIAPAATGATLETVTAPAIDRSLAGPAFGVGTRELGNATGWERGSEQEIAWRATIHPDDLPATRALLESARMQHRPYGMQYRVLDAGGKERVAQEYGSFAVGSPPYATVIDVTEHTGQELELRHLANYDALTGLPNRSLFLERIAAAANEVRDSGHVAAVLMFSLTGFESVNATFGRACGDEVLRQVALRLGESVRGGDTVARITSHTFGVLLTDIDTVESVAALGRHILESLYAPFAVGPRTHHLAARLGISLTPRNGPDAAALLQAAETAMAAASRKEARSRIAWFSSDMSAIVKSELNTEEALRVALERKEFVLHYQPIVDTETGQIAAVEALIRWNHPTRGLVMPGEFIEVAEQSGLVGALGDWALGEACRQARLWHDLGFELRICVNVSTVRFRQPAFVDLVKSVLAESGIPPRMIEIEVTESVMVQGFADVVETLAKLKQTGVRLSIDDFGTGYSSLSYLKYFPVDNLKLDRAFVADIVSDTFDRAIAKTVLTLAAELSMDCIAEGVETKEQLDLLRRFGCRLIQGYYFSRPLPPEALAGKLWRPPSE
jgi:photoactive yellow protein